MKDVVLDEVKKELTEVEMKEILKRICNYYNGSTQLIEEYFKNSWFFMDDIL